MKNISLPHIGACTRIKLSKVHRGGIGVFAILDIPKGTNVFKGDTTKMVWIDRDRIKDVDPGIRSLYEDFCIVKGNKYGCPANFNSMTIGWYLNDSKKPNMAITKNYDFVAIRDIRKNEELTTDYSTFTRHHRTFPSSIRKK